MRRIFTFVFLLSLNFGFGHDLKMAIFEISKGEEGLKVEVSVDNDAFISALENDCAESLESHPFEDATWEYLDSRLKISIDGKYSGFHVEEIESAQQNLLITGYLKVDQESLKDIEEIAMSNTCLIESVEGQDNIMRLKINDRQRSFRLNASRTFTIAEY